MLTTNSLENIEFEAEKLIFLSLSRHFVSVIVPTMGEKM